MYELIEEPYLLEFLTAPERHTRLFQELYSRWRSRRWCTSGRPGRTDARLRRRSCPV